MSVYNLENIFSSGYVDAAALRLLLESVIEDQKNINLKQLNNFKTKTITKFTGNDKFLINNDLYSEDIVVNSSTKININGKDVYCTDIFTEEEYIQNIKKVECFYEVFEIENNQLIRKITSGSIFNTYIRTNDNNKISIKYDVLNNLRSLANKSVVVLNFKYQTTDDFEQVEVIDNEKDYSDIDKLLFISDI